MKENSLPTVEVSLSPRAVKVISRLIKEGVFKSASEAAAKIIEAHLDLILEEGAYDQKSEEEAK